ncbi:unnamed protein product [Colias eurytheme]|nr:unnamed protein product [Colias eurytheme]
MFLLSISRYRSNVDDGPHFALWIRAAREDIDFRYPSRTVSGGASRWRTPDLPHAYSSAKVTNNVPPRLYQNTQSRYIPLSLSDAFHNASAFPLLLTLALASQ